MRRSLPVLFALIACASALQARADEDTAAEAASDAHAVNQAPPPVNLDLDERIQPVSGSLFLKDGRHEISPRIALSLGDPFFSKYIVGLEYGYHLSEKWMLGFNAGYAVTSPSGAVTRCDSSGQDCRLPSKSDLTHAPGDIGFIAGVDVSWAPLYGKISVMAESVLHFDTYLLAGAGAIQTRMADPDGTEVREQIKPEVHLGVGQRYVISRHTALRFEIRDVLYQAEIQGRSGPETSIQNQLLFGVGLSFFIGQGPEA